MGRNLSLLGHLPRLEEDGVTHRRDCECVRCDAGFGPSEHERAEARRRFEERQERERAERAVKRARERERMKQVERDLYVDAQVQAADAQVRALREARARGAGDRRLAELWRLRRAGYSLRAALDAVDDPPAAAESTPRG
jgi:hypothetical protein